MSVQILLSTYNGELYLKPLLDSLLAQDCSGVNILIRDDGSTDGTRSLLREYATLNNNIDVLLDEHCGFVESFFSLIAHASSTAEYFALCDQDDVWQPDKVSRAVELLSRCRPEIPALYGSRLSLVDRELTPMGFSGLPKKGLSFCNALVECPAPGCTLVFNRAARQILLLKFPKYAWSHDMWIYLVTSAFGTILYDPEPKIFYRKHSANAIGISVGIREMWKIKITRFLKDAKLHLLIKQAEEFRRIYGASLSNEHRKILDRFLDSRRRFWRRLGYALSCEVYRQSTLDQCILRARIALDCL